MNHDKHNKTVEFDYVEGLDEYLQEKAIAKKPEGFLRMLNRALQTKQEREDWSRLQLAQALGCKLAYIEHLFSGRVNPHSFERAFLEKVATVLEMDFETVCLLVGINTARFEQTLQDKKQIADYLLNEVSDVLFETIDERYSLPVAEDTDERARYDTVIEELQAIIARQRRDMRFVQELVEGLKHPEKEVMRKPADIIELRHHLKRIIKRLEA